MRQDEIYDIWRRNFAYECWVRDIDLKRYEQITNKENTNFCCTLTGSRTVSYRKIHQHCIELNIPPQIVFFRFIPPEIPVND